MPSAKKTPNIQLNQWVGEEYVKRQDFVDDNLKIDTEIGKLKESIKNIDLVDSKVKVTDLNNKFTATTLDKVLDEIDDKIVDTNDKVDNIDLAANKVKYTDTTTQIGATNVQQALEWAVREIKALKQEVTGQTTRLNGINTELEAEIGNPVQEVQNG